MTATGGAAVGRRGQQASSRGLAAITLLLPIVIVNAFGFLGPVVYLLRMSFNRYVSGGGLQEDFTFDNYAGFLTDSFYLELVLNSVVYSACITLATLIVSYPIALFLYRAPPRWKAILTVLTISPLLISAVVRTYGWMLILGDRGLLNDLLIGAGLISSPLRVSNNLTGVTVGLVEILMPYMILSLQAGFGRLDVSLEEAAQTLGARPWTTFRRVILPLSLPGIALGSLLCFVLAISSFITPKLLGGGRVLLLATEIYDQAIVLLNWPLAATMSIIILAIFIAALIVYSRIVRSFD